MAWFGPSGNCGCCPVCDCLDGLTEARRFNGTPTVKVVISDVLDEFEYQTTTYFSFPSAWRDRVKISGVSSIAGTYFFELTKTASGCIDLISGSSETQIIGSYTSEVTRQTINGTTCAAGSPTVTSVARDVELVVESLASYMAPGPPPFSCPHVISKIFQSFLVPDRPTSAAAMIAHTSTRCQDNYEPSESIGQCHQSIYQFVNEGRLRTYDVLSGVSTDCGSTRIIDIDWASFVVTIEDL
jgi:hypothetical protein